MFELDLSPRGTWPSSGLSAWKSVPFGPVTWPDLRGRLSANDRERPLVESVRLTVELPSAAAGRCPFTCGDGHYGAPGLRKSDSPGTGGTPAAVTDGGGGADMRRAKIRYGRRSGPAGLAPSGPRTGSYAARPVSGNPRTCQVDVAARPIWDLGGRRHDPAGFAGIVRRTICWPGPVFGLWGRATVAGWKPGGHDHVFAPTHRAALALNSLLAPAGLRVFSWGAGRSGLDRIRRSPGTGRPGRRSASAHSPFPQLVRAVLQDRGTGAGH